MCLYRGHQKELLCGTCTFHCTYISDSFHLSNIFRHTHIKSTLRQSSKFYCCCCLWCDHDRVILKVLLMVVGNVRGCVMIAIAFAVVSDFNSHFLITTNAPMISYKSWFILFQYLSGFNLLLRSNVNTAKFN